MGEGVLNVDFAARISELESLMNKLSLKWITYKSLFRGKGLEFDSYREYSFDDDAGSIDWMASARSNQILVKKYIEERDLKVIFLIDGGDNMVFGSSEKLKCECAAEVAASLAHLVLLSGDKVGFVFFKDNSFEEVVLPEGGMRRFGVFSQELINAKNYGGKPKSLDIFLNFLIDYLDDSINAVFIISDFLHIGNNFKDNFELFSKKFETIPILVRDFLDEKLPPLDSEFVIEDPSSGKQITLNSAVARKTYERLALKDKETLLNIFNDLGIEHLEIKTNEQFIPLLVQFLNERSRRKRFIVPRN